MRLTEISSNSNYLLWQRAVRVAFPDSTFVGNDHQSQAVDWNSTNNEVAGDWENGQGVVYEPGSMGRKILKTIGDR